MIFLSHESALAFWLAYRNGKPPTCNYLYRMPSEVGSSASFEAIEETLRRLAHDEAALRPIVGGDQPVHVLVDGRSHHSRASGALIAHTISRSLPSRSFYRAHPELAVASPELCFIQAARSLDMVEAVRLGVELCSAYRTCGDCSAHDSITALSAPVTDAHSIRSYVSRYYLDPSKRVAGAAARIIPDGAAASPMEVCLALSLILPTKCGGYQLPPPLLNHSLTLTSIAKYHTRRGSLICDLYWPERRLDVEYDSDQFHLTSKQRGLDSSRADILTRMNVNLVSVTPWQFKRAAEFDSVVKSIRAMLGLHVMKNSKERSGERLQLRARLLSTAESSPITAVKQSYFEPRATM